MNLQKVLPYTLLLIFLLVPLTALQKGDVEKGRKVFEQCSVCHNTDSDEKKVGPSLKGLFQHGKLKSGNTVSDESVLEQINKGGKGMPSFAEKLSADEKQSLIAYLHTL